MDKTDPILITGGTGMVGARLVEQLSADGFSNLLVTTRNDLDLCDEQSVDRWFDQHRPRYAFLIAAKVGGIAANIADPTAFLSDNLKIVVNQLGACHRVGVEKVLLLGSTCIYPRECPQPMKEEYLLDGPLEPTNEGYALAKIAGLRLAQAYQKQHGMKCVLPMPCNIYGTNDHFDLSRCHVLSALVKRFSDAVTDGADEVVLWGSGIARREFIHVDDVVDGMLHLFENAENGEIVNLGPGTDVSISELAGMIAEETGFVGNISWDTSRPDGMLRKCTDNTRLSQLGFRTKIALRDGIRRTILQYKQICQASISDATGATAQTTTRRVA
ncbi:GDP-L-fucose synthase family protein [Rhodopirellula sallentina]|uniref:GDP-L-fucose synthase n=1 Tax=Rhodopirellula sallentina SM41 TaxID=1263870 RepID=M5UD50_9BACT|nr:GDP-L-fucose synthase [Rhodopirellula sallentina]EMI55776.1 GDP-L-fucose synthase [Rhodopirellula sallentina SM41]